MEDLAPKDYKKIKQRPFGDDDPGKGSGDRQTKEVEESTTGPLCNMFHKGKHEKCFVYTAHTACDWQNVLFLARLYVKCRKDI